MHFYPEPIPAGKCHDRSASRRSGSSAPSATVSSYGLDIVATTGLPSGTVYPALGRLKSARMVRASWEDQRIAEREGRPRRRYYALTAAGASALADGVAEFRRLASDLEPGRGRA